MEGSVSQLRLRVRVAEILDMLKFYLMDLSQEEKRLSKGKDYQNLWKQMQREFGDHLEELYQLVEHPDVMMDKLIPIVYMLEINGNSQKIFLRKVLLFLPRLLSCYLDEEPKAESMMGDILLDIFRHFDGLHLMKDLEASYRKCSEKNLWVLAESSPLMGSLWDYVEELVKYGKTKYGNP
nr:MAG TPA: hypothetical protein [Caudoviricetes sp.]